MEDKSKQPVVDQLDEIYTMSAVELSKSTNAHIGIVAYGKAFYYRQEVLEEMQSKVNKVIDIGHLIVLTKDKGQDIGFDSGHVGLSLHALDTTAEEWLQQVAEQMNEENEEEDEAFEEIES